MKNKLIVLYEEDKENPKNTWSGTSFQLREALKNYYDVIFIDSSDSKALSILKTITKKIEKKGVSFILKPFYEFLHRITINKKLKDYKDIPVLEISENVVVDNDFYLYRDMAYACYPYVLEKFKDDNKDYGKGMLRHISSATLKRRIENEKKLIEKSKCNLFMGQWNVDILNKTYPSMSNKFIAAGGGLNNDFDCKVSNADNKRIIFVGIDYLRKGGDLLVDAFKILKSKYDADAELIVVGTEIKNNIDGITYTGKIDKKELSKLFSESCVFCMPSRFEAYGLVFIEALCYGLPIVAYDDYEMHYFVNDGVNGYLIKDYDAEKLAESLHNALNNKEMINRVKENATKIKEEYSWNNVAKKITEIINERSYN